MIKAQWATLLSVYHLKPEEILKLTDWQIHELYYHPREEDGSIVPVERLDRREPKTLTEALIQWESVAVQFRMRPEDVEAGREKLRRKWANEGTNGGTEREKTG